MAPQQMGSVQSRTDGFDMELCYPPVPAVLDNAHVDTSKKDKSVAWHWPALARHSFDPVPRSKPQKVTCWTSNKTKFDPDFVPLHP